MDRVIDILIVLLCGFGGVAFTAWRVERSIKHEVRFFRERTGEQDKQLAVVNAELQFARSEVSQLRCELTIMRHAVEYLAEGPHSQRPRAQQAS